MKKIILILNDLEKGGGTQKVANLLINNFNKSQYNVKAILIYKHLVDYNINIDIIKLQIPKYGKTIFNKISNFTSRIKNLRCYIKKEKPDIIISFMTHQNMLTVLSCLFLKNKPKIILTEHNPPSIILPRLPFPLKNKYFYNFLYSLADYLVPVSKGMGREMIDKFRLPSSKIRPIYNPIDIKDINNRSKERIILSKIKEKPIIISAGRLTYQKGFDILLHSFKEILEKIDCYLFILGKGEEENRLKELTKELGINNNVIFLGFQDNPFKYIKKADIFVLPSRWEGFPCILEEVMALGIPVIAADCNYGPREIIEDNKYGILFPVSNSKELSKIIIRTLLDKKLKNQLSLLAHKRAQDFSVEKIISEYEKLF